MKVTILEPHCNHFYPVRGNNPICGTVFCCLRLVCSSNRVKEKIFLLLQGAGCVADETRVNYSIYWRVCVWKYIHSYITIFTVNKFIYTFPSYLSFHLFLILFFSHTVVQSIINNQTKNFQMKSVMELEGETWYMVAVTQGRIEENKQGQL